MSQPCGRRHLSAGGTVTLSNTIVGTQTAGGNCAGSIADRGYNLEDGTSCAFSTANQSLPNTNPLLDPRGPSNNGGPTLTIALQQASPAVDAIPPGTNGCGTTVTTDQRGVPRPQGRGCDVGAFEPRNRVGADAGGDRSHGERHRGHLVHG